jgi:hypothetical protein
MRRIFLPTFLIASVLFLATTFAGMAFFGMGTGGVQMEGTCMGMSCGSMDHGTAPSDCLDHCIGQVSPATTVPVSTAIPLLLLLAFCLLADLPLPVGRFIPGASRWREGIGKFLRHQSLSTVILRN